MRGLGLHRALLPPLLLAAAAAVSPAQAQAPAANPANRAMVEKAFGAGMAGTIFSAKLAPLRRDLIDGSLKNNAAPGCPKRPGFNLIVNPLQADAEATVWEERYVIACEPRVRRSAIVTWQGGKLQGRESTPGDTVTGLALRNELFPPLAMFAGGPDCPDAKNVSVTNTRRLTTPGKPAAPWSEMWTLKTCGVSRDVEISFTPNETDGGTSWTFTIK